MSDAENTRPPLPDDPEVANGANPGGEPGANPGSSAEPEADIAVEEDTIAATEPGGEAG